jgi:hypothetical protein
MRNGLPFLIAVLTLVSAAPAAGFEFGDAVPIVTGSTPGVRAASSGPGHGTALHLLDPGDSRVAFQDRAGAWHRFRPPGAPARVALAQIEDGSGLAAWADAGSVYVRIWSREGELSPAQPVLTGRGLWRLAADRSGTVAIAAADQNGALTVTVRDPGAGFSAPQAIGASRSFTLLPIEADGSVSVRFGSQQATRSGRTGPFVTSTPVDKPVPPNLWQADDSRHVLVGSGVLRLCHTDGCNAPKLFAWGKRELIAFRRPAADGARWYIARRQPNGRFDDPEFAVSDFFSLPVWTPGGLAFTRLSLGDAEQRLRGVYLIPLSGTSKLRPRLYLGSVGSRFGRVHFDVFCRSACTVDGTINGIAVSRRVLSPLETGELSVVVPPGTKRLRIALVARDERGRTTRVTTNDILHPDEIFPPDDDGELSAR